MEPTTAYAFISPGSVASTAGVQQKAQVSQAMTLPATVLNISNDPTFLAMERCNKTLRSNDAQFPNLEIRLLDLLDTLKRHLSRDGYQPQMFLVKSVAAQALGGPESLHWHLEIEAIHPSSAHPLATKFKDHINEATGNYFAERLGAKHSMLALREAYGLHNDTLRDAWVYRMGPDITLRFFHTPGILENPSEWDGWTIAVPQGHATCQVGKQSLSQQELIDTAARVKERTFVSKGDTNLLMPALRAMGHGAVLQNPERIRQHLVALSQAQLTDLWKDAFCQPGQRSCQKTEWIHFLNLLLLAEGQVQKIGQLWLDTHADASDPCKAFAQALVARPDLAPLLMAEIQTLLLLQWCKSTDNAGPQLWQLPFINDRLKPRAAAAIPCEQQTLHLWLAAPGQAENPADIMIRFLDTHAERGQIDRAPFAPAYALLGLVPLDSDLATTGKHLESAWQTSRMQALLANNFTDGDLKGRRLRNWLKRERGKPSVERKVAAPVVEMKMPPAPTREKIKGKNKNKPVEPDCLPKSSKAQQLLTQWHQDAAQALSGDLEQCQQIADALTAQWPAVKESAAKKPADQTAALAAYVDVLIASGKAEHLQLALSLALKSQELMTAKRHVLILEALTRIAPVAATWPNGLQQAALQFLTLPTEYPDAVVALLTQLPPNLHHVFGRVVLDPGNTVLNSLETQKKANLVLTYTQAAIRDKLWLPAISYAKWAKMHLNAKDFDDFDTLTTFSWAKALELYMKTDIPSSLQCETLLNYFAEGLPFLKVLDDKSLATSLSLIYSHLIEHAAHHEPQVTQATRRLHQTIEDMRLLKDRVHVSLQHNCLLLSLCASPWDDRLEEQIHHSLKTLMRVTEFKERTNCSVLRVTVYTCMIRLFERLITQPTKGKIAVDRFENFIKEHWAPLIREFEKHGYHQVGLEATFAVALRILTNSAVCNLLRDAMHQRPNESNPVALLKACDKWKDKRLAVLTDSEREMAVETAYFFMQGRSTAEMKATYSGLFNAVMAPVAAELIALAQADLPKLAKINPDFAANSIMTITRLITLAADGWDLVPNNASNDSIIEARKLLRPILSSTRNIAVRLSLKILFPNELEEKK